MDAYRTLSKGMGNLTPGTHFDVIVVGSGYGGAVTAARLAGRTKPDGIAGGKPVSVCVLERGKEFLPGQFPDDIADLPPEVQISTPHDHLGFNEGLFDIRINNDVSALVGCALGGTSQINANVALEPDQEVFERPRWPPEFREKESRKIYYDRARCMLEPRAFPLNKYRKPAKLDALERYAQHLQCHNAPATITVQRAPITVHFDDKKNNAGVQQYECKRCGDCISGCNHGAKNTLTMNYLPWAERRGAEIYSGVTVMRIEREPDRLSVDYLATRLRSWQRTIVRPVAENQGENIYDSITADVVILAAGTFGSTEILLRSRTDLTSNGRMESRRDGRSIWPLGLPSNSRIGTGFSCNGDMIAFGVGHESEINGVGNTPLDKDINPPGPCITGGIKVGPGGERVDRMLIQEGAAPSAFRWILSELATTGSVLHNLPTSSLARAWRVLFPPEWGKDGDPFAHSEYRLQHTQTYLVVGHDSHDGNMILDQDRIRLNWPGARKAYEEQDKLLSGSVAALGGTYVPSPAWRLLPEGFYLDNSVLQGSAQRLVTVHPLGGCPMGETADQGAVNYDCQVFGEDREVIRGLYVCDGSIMPTSLGANPLLTIAALAERCADRIAAARNWKPAAMRVPVPVVQDKPCPAPAPTGENALNFEEVMEGTFWSDPDTVPAVTRSVRGRLIINASDLLRMLMKRSRSVPISGSVTGLIGEELVVQKGAFRLFTRDPVGFGSRLAYLIRNWGNSGLESRRMEYSLELCSKNRVADNDDEWYYLEGVKKIRRDAGQDLWDALTTLNATIYRGKKQRRLIGYAELHYAPEYFRLPQLTSESDGIQALAAFSSLGLFATRVLGVSFAQDFMKRPEYRARDEFTNPVDLVANRESYYREEHRLNDRVPMPLLTHYVPRQSESSRKPVILFPGFGISTACYTLPTIDKNLAQFLLGKGYDVWLADYRTSTLLDSHEEPTSLDEIAEQDYPRLINKVLELTGQQQVRVFAHCMGAEVFCMAVLGGWVPPGQIRAAVLSQVGPIVEGTPLNQFKAQFADLLVSVHGEALVNPCATETTGRQAILDRVLNPWPVPKGEECNNPTCHRMTALYGLLVSHRNVRSTHDRLVDLLGPANLRTFRHLATIFKAQKLVAEDGADRYVPNLDRMSFPVGFIHGSENGCFRPGCTSKSVERLRRANDRISNFEEIYQRREFEGYGHFDCLLGDRAHLDIFPTIAAYLEAQQPGLVSKTKVPGLDDILHNLARPALGPVIGATGEHSVRIFIAADGSVNRPVGAAAVIFLPGQDNPVAVQYEPVLTAAENGELAHVFQFGGLTPSTRYEVITVVVRRDQDLCDFLGSISASVPASSTSPLDDGIAWLLRRVPENTRAVGSFRTMPDGNPQKLRFLLASCRHPGLWIDENLATQSTEGLRKRVKSGEQEQADLPAPQFLILAGDQIYADPLPLVGGKARTPGDFRIAYRRAFDEGPLKEVLAGIPTYMMLDDHEIQDNWEPYMARDARSRAVRDAALDAFEVYQRSHGPLPLVSRTYSYPFVAAGFPFYMLDSRTQRVRSGSANRINDNHMLGGPCSLTPLELLAWLIRNKDDDRPKFIVTPTAFVPNTVASVDDPYFNDSWAAFPTTRRALLQCIAANDINNVVFLSGDSHCSMAAGIEIKRYGKPDLGAIAITSSPLFCPYAFTKGDATRYVGDSDLRGPTGRTDVFPVDTDDLATASVKMHYKVRGGFETRDNFTQIDVDMVSTPHRLHVHRFDRDGQRLETINFDLA